MFDELFNRTTTTNGMVAYSTTKSNLLDMFFEIGNLKDVNDSFLSICRRAYKEDKYGFISVLLWARDCRQGAGRRNVPRVLLRRLFEKKLLKYDEANIILSKLVELGRWDDTWAVALNTPYDQYLTQLIETGLKNKDGLLAKWLPRKGPQAAQIRRLLKMPPKTYRKTIVSLTNVVETPICEGRFHDIDYSKVPSQAMLRYTKLFNKKDAWRFEEYKEKLASGKTKVNTKTLYPYQIIRNIHVDRFLAENQWKDKIKEVQTKNTSFLPVIDVSGSMTWESGAGVPCIDIAVSLGIMLSECANNSFAYKFITFSEKPGLFDLSRFDTLYEKIRYVRSSPWGYNTNLEAVFNLVLQYAREKYIPANMMPKYLLIISDMQFDEASTTSLSAIQMIKDKYREYGYEAPTVVFWNVAKNYNNYPSIQNEEGAILISGFNTNLLNTLIESPENINPYNFLLQVLQNPRYQITSQSSLP